MRRWMMLIFTGLLAASLTGLTPAARAQSSASSTEQTATPAADDDLAGALTIAENLYTSRKFDKAAAAYRDVLPRLEGEQAAEARYRLAFALQLRGGQAGREEAIGLYQKVVDDSDAPVSLRSLAQFRLGACLRLLNRHEEAVRELAKVDAIPGRNPTDAANGWLFAGYSHRNLEQFEEADAAYDRVLAIADADKNTHANALQAKAGLAVDRDEPERAIELLNAALALEPHARIYERVTSRLLELESLMAGDLPFYIEPYVSQVTPGAATVYWVSQGMSTPGTITLHAADGAAGAADPEDEQHEATSRVQPMRGADHYFRHEVRLDNLQPHTRYRYRVVTEDQTVEGSFMTAPDSSATQPPAFTFSVIGDTQTDRDAHTPVPRNIGDDHPAFVLHVGDLVDRGDQWGDWKAQMFDPGRPYLKQASIHPVVGNHDGGPFYGQLFGQEDRHYYTFTWGNLRVIGLDSYGPGAHGDARAEQVKWLEEVLARNDATWTVVHLHVPIIPSRSDIEWFGKDDFLPLLEKHGVDFVFSGHHHLYRRLRPIGSGKHPIFHITTGGAGGSLGGAVPSALHVVAQEIHHHLTFHVDGHKLEMIARDRDGNELDRLHLVKTDGVYQPEVMARTVSNAVARQVYALYNDIAGRFGVLEATLAEAPEPGRDVNIAIDLNTLPGGALDATELPTGSALVVRSVDGSRWGVNEQAIPLTGDRIAFIATAPDDEHVRDGDARFNMELWLRVGELELERATVSVRAAAPALTADAR